jgi:hypothetical protein
MTERASNWASNGALQNMPNAASNSRAMRRHKGARLLRNRTEPAILRPAHSTPDDALRRSARVFGVSRTQVTPAMAQSNADKEPD